MKKALTIAGFDPTGGAGLQEDLKVFQALGVYGLSAVAALTAQNTRGVKSVEQVNRGFLKKQLDVLLTDLMPDATKMGMLLSEDNVKVAARIIKKYALQNVVLDPVFISSSGKRLAEPGLPALIRKLLLPLCDVITPNMHEASVLSGTKITSHKEMEKAAAILRDAGPGMIIITGGHLDGHALDVIYNGSFHYLKARKRCGEFHGTGCTFSAAITAFLARGYSGLDAAKNAKEFMAMAFQKAIRPGSGMKLFVI
ncbi:MAG: bifunctional hydroxymethylpyrimidine kinase/phosphomethylpyrimidine kinase [Nitrospirota bacterium]|nr:bifunctional hydroxymethylpyrimidine kinase/phosphomethylpyrimidine kinase [Nitrospirota bacterium]